jgi:hypothetical protein
MNNLPELNTLNILLGWIAVFSTSILLITVGALIKSHRQIQRLREEEKAKWQELEVRAQREYQEIIQNANKKAQEIMLQSIQIKKDATNNFQSSLDSIVQNQKDVLSNTSLEVTGKYKELIERANQQNIDILTNIYKDIEKQAKNSYSRYVNLLEHQTFEAEKIAETRMKEEYEKLEIELKQQKELKLQELNEKIFKIIQKVSKEVIGRSITPADHDTLIIEALEKAKKEGSL